MLGFSPLELEALALTQHPIVRAAYERVRKSWLEAADPSADMRGCFEHAFEEVMFSAAVWSLNQDPLRPKVVCITRLAHCLGDLPIPGSRWGQTYLLTKMLTGSTQRVLQLIRCTEGSLNL